MMFDKYIIIAVTTAETLVDRLHADQRTRFSNIYLPHEQTETKTNVNNICCAPRERNLEHLR